MEMIHSLDDDSLKSDINCILNITSSAYGYFGGHILLRSNSIGGSASFSSSSSRFFSECRTVFRNDAIRILLDILGQTKRMYGDGGWFGLMMSTRLIALGIESDIPITLLTSGYLTALRHAEAAIEDKALSAPLKLSVSWSDHLTIMCLIKSVLQSRTSLGLSDKEIDHMCEILLTAFLSSLNDKENMVLFPNIFYRKCPGMCLDNTTAFEDALVMDIPIPIHLMHSTGRNLKVALFDCSLELSAGDVGLSLDIDCNNDDESVVTVKDTEFLFLEHVARVIIRSRVSLVCSQRRIHPYLQRILLAEGVIPLQRLSIRYITAMQNLTGAKLLGNFSSVHVMSADSTIETDLLGFLSSIGVECVGGKKFVVARADACDESESDYRHNAWSRRLKTATILICASSDDDCEELQVSFESIVRILTDLMEHPFVLPGSGFWQAIVCDRLGNAIKSMRLNNRSLSWEDRAVVSAMDLFRSALSTCVRAQMDSRVGADMDDLITMFSAAVNSEGCCEYKGPTGTLALARRRVVKREEDEALESVGPDEVRVEALSAVIVDAYLPSIRMLQQAVEAAVAVLQVDGYASALPKETTT